MIDRLKLLTIAGSDPSGGAGIQQDLRVFTCLGGYGSTVIAAVTVQNTRGVRAFSPVDAPLLRSQLEVLLEDVPFHGVKTGMLGNSENVRVVADVLRESPSLLVVDPVLSATEGGDLYQGEREAFVDALFPLAAVITPNREELQRLFPGLSPLDAAREMIRYGAKGVVVTGGDSDSPSHMVDLVVTKRDAVERVHPKTPLPTQKSHGTGCAFSSLLLFMLAKGLDLPIAYEQALELMEDALRHASSPGGGMASPDPLVVLDREVAVRGALEGMGRAVLRLESVEGMGLLIPEIQSNLCYALPNPRSHLDVLGIKGRIIRWGGYARAMGPVVFGASRHVANIVLTANRHDPSIRSAMALRYEPQWVEVLQREGYRIASFSRQEEPAEVKEREGSTLAWGVDTVCRREGEVPMFIYDEGDVGKEPVIRLLGTDPESVVNTAVEVLGLLVPKVGC